MQKLKSSILINAPKEVVWKTMFDDATYRQWTEAFSKGGYFKGDWSEGSKILFIGPGEDGKEGGMVSRIKTNRPYEYMSIEHLGIYNDGKEDYESEEVKKWTPAFENYTFTEKDGMTEVSIDMDINDENKESFQKMWDEALKRLKEISERAI